MSSNQISDLIQKSSDSDQIKTLDSELDHHPDDWITDTGTKYLVSRPISPNADHMAPYLSSHPHTPNLIDPESPTYSLSRAFHHHSDIHHHLHHLSNQKDQTSKNAHLLNPHLSIPLKIYPRSKSLANIRDQYSHHHHHLNDTNHPDTSNLSPSPNYIIATPEMLQDLCLESQNRIKKRVGKEEERSKGELENDLGIKSLNKSHSIQLVPEKNGSVEQIEYVNPPSTTTDSATLQSCSPIPSPLRSLPRNPYQRFKLVTREFAAEFLGTCILILFGNGVNNQVVLNSSRDVSSSDKGDYLSISFGWGIGVMIGVYVAGGISGGHLNPAVTLSLATFRGFSWKKVLPYWVAQVLGAWLGATLVQAIYSEALNLYEGTKSLRTVTGTRSTGALFFTSPADYMSNVNCFFQEFLNTAILLLVILAISDRQNSPAPDGMNPFILLWLIVGLGACLGSQTAYAINPARDFGPRIMASCFGYGVEVWSFRSFYWIWTPWIATCAGGLVGSMIYDLFIYTGSDSPLNQEIYDRFINWFQKEKDQEFKEDDDHRNMC
ncbi:aquaporin-like protein [Melampsora americana]|nr:aquaporin-like protein [Melampsora americana]